MEFIEKVKDTINRYKMIEKGDKVLIGCSGGIDSMVLLDCLYRLKDEYDIEIVVAHVNHMLREEAEDDERFVIDACKKYGVRCVSKKIDVKKIKEQFKLSEEESGRIARYNFFYEVVEALNLNRILLGHNKNDVVETFFLNLFRGSGLDGLCSIPPKRDIIARPLLFVSRKEIEEYANQNRIPFVLDKTNLTVKYKRNIVRNVLIPLVEKEFNRDIIDTISKTVELIRDDNLGINQLADDAYNSCVKLENDFYVLNLECFNSFEFFIQKRVIKKIFKMLDFIPSYENLMSIYSLLPLQAGKKMIFNEIIVEKQQGNELVFYKNVQKDDFCFEIPLKEEYYIRYKNLFFEFYIVSQMDENSALYLDAGLINDRIFLRNRRKGDFIYLKVGKKKLKEFFIDTKIPRRHRDKIPLIALDNEVIVLFNIYQNRYLINERFKTKQNTKKYLKIKVTIMEGVGGIEVYREEG